MATRFDYPANGWSTGKMRKRGEKLAMDMQRRGQPESALAEMERAAGMGLAARGGTATQVGGVDVSGIGRPAPAQMIEQHRAQLEEATSQYAQGAMSLANLKKLFKSFGWTSDISGMSVEATAPDGTQHTFGKEAEAR